MLWNVYLVNDPARLQDDLSFLESLEGVMVSRTATSQETEYTPAFALATLRMPTAKAPDVLTLPSAVSLSPAPTLTLLGEPEALISANQTQFLAGAEVPKLPSAGGTRYIPWLQARLTTSTNPNYSAPGEYPIAVVTDNGAGNGYDPAGPTSPQNEPALWASDLTVPDFRMFGDEPSYNAAKPSRFALSFRWDAHAESDSGAKFTSNDGVSTHPTSGFSHGHRVASMLAGFSAASGDARRNLNDLNYGAGISPFGRLGNVLLDGVLPPYTVGFPAVSFRNMVAQYSADVVARNGNPPSPTGILYKLFRAHPALISTNSWGVWLPIESRYVYDAIAYEVDKTVRDTIAGGRHQPMLFVAAAGNQGASDGDDSVVSPALAKNVIAVGMSESVHAAPLGANDASGSDARNVDAGTSQGASSGRTKPDLVAPGAFAYVNRRTLLPNNPAPLASTVEPSVYCTDWGTSYAAPQVAGAAQVVCKFIRDRHGVVNPSPALLKAYLIMTAKFLNGANTGTGDAKFQLPTRWQGFGRIDLSRAVDVDASGNAIPTFLYDQRKLLKIGTPAEQEYSITGRIADPDRPFRAVLVWTDPVSLTSGGLIQNDLNLTVTKESFPVRYLRGNRFASDQHPTDPVAVSSLYKNLNASPDSVNNVEAIFAPNTYFDASDPLTVKVAGSTIPADCYNSGGPGRQDFALVVYNFIPNSPQSIPAERVQDTATLPPGEWGKNFVDAVSSKFGTGAMTFTPAASPAADTTTALTIASSAAGVLGSWEFDGTSGHVGGRLYRNIWTLDTVIGSQGSGNPWMRLRSGSSSNRELGQFESVFESVNPTGIPLGNGVKVESWLLPKLTPDGVPLESPGGKSFDRPIFSFDLEDRGVPNLTATLREVRTDSFARRDLLPDPVTPILANWGVAAISGSEATGETGTGRTAFPTSPSVVMNFYPHPGTSPPVPVFQYGPENESLKVTFNDTNALDLWLADVEFPTAFSLSNDRLYIVDAYLTRTTAIPPDDGPVLRIRFLPSDHRNSPVNNFDLSPVAGSNPAALDVQGSARRYSMAFRPQAIPGVTHKLHIDFRHMFSGRAVTGEFVIERVIVRSYLVPPVVE